MSRKSKSPATMRTVSIKLDMDAASFVEMEKLQAAYAAACNLLVPTVVETRCWNAYSLHTKAYTRPSRRNTARISALLQSSALGHSGL